MNDLNTVKKFQAIIGLVFALIIVTPANAINIDEKIFNFQQKMADAGNVKAQYKLAYMYETGRGVNRDLSKAQQWYQKSAEKGYISSQHRITYIEVKRNGFKPKHRAWIKQLKADADSDDKVMFLLANMYETGIGVKDDLNKARYYYKKSTAKGNADAETRLFALEQRMRRVQEKQAAKEAEEKALKKAQLLAEKKAREEKRAKQKEQQAKLKKLQQQKQLEAKKAEKAKKELAKQRKQEQQKIKQAKQVKPVPTIAVKEAETEVEEVFETDLCSGKAARFRTQCN